MRKKVDRSTSSPGFIRDETLAGTKFTVQTVGLSNVIRMDLPAKNVRLNWRLMWLTAAAVVTISGCATSPENQSAKLDVEVPAQFSDEAAVSNTFDQLSWLMDFNDPQLLGLVDEALLNNRDLQAAAARLEAAGASMRVVDSARHPQLGGSANASVRNTILERPDGSLDRGTVDSYGLGLNLFWEIDVWGKLKNRSQAAMADLEEQAALYQAAQFSLAANTLKSWFTTVEAELLLQLANETLEVFEQNLQVVEASYKRGLPDRALDVRLTRANVEGARSTKYFRERMRDASGRSLETLLGRYPADAVEVVGSLPVLNFEIPPGLPSELLSRRPDLIAAERRLAGSLERVKVAKKEMLPTLSLTSNAGNSSGELRDILDLERVLWNVAGNLAQPIFQGGRLIAGVDLADANSRQALASYAQTVLSAFREVETLLAAEDYLREELSALERAAAESVAAEGLAWQQYQRGLVDIITVLESQRRAFNAQNALLNAFNDRLANRINLYLALGGDFGRPEPVVAVEKVALSK